MKKAFFLFVFIFSFHQTVFNADLKKSDSRELLSGPLSSYILIGPVSALSLGALGYRLRPISPGVWGALSLFFLGGVFSRYGVDKEFGVTCVAPFVLGGLAAKLSKGTCCETNRSLRNRCAPKKSPASRGSHGALSKLARLFRNIRR
jgi:hypothetical protein